MRLRSDMPRKHLSHHSHQTRQESWQCSLAPTSRLSHTSHHQGDLPLNGDHGGNTITEQWPIYLETGHLQLSDVFWGVSFWHPGGSLLSFFHSPLTTRKWHTLLMLACSLTFLSVLPQSTLCNVSVLLQICEVKLQSFGYDVSYHNYTWERYHERISCQCIMLHQGYHEKERYHMYHDNVSCFGYDVSCHDNMDDVFCSLCTFVSYSFSDGFVINILILLPGRQNWVGEFILTIMW